MDENVQITTEVVTGNPEILFAGELLEKNVPDFTQDEEILGKEAVEQDPKVQ